MFLLSLRWHCVQFTLLLCIDLTPVTALLKFVPPVPLLPWHERQKVEPGNVREGMVSVELWIQPVLWHCGTVHPGLEELYLRLWLVMRLLYSGSIIAVANAVLAFWWQ